MNVSTAGSAAAMPTRGLVRQRQTLASLVAVTPAAADIVLAPRRRWRLAAYLLVTGVGALVLDPVLKSLVGRPTEPHPGQRHFRVPLPHRSQAARFTWVARRQVDGVSSLPSRAATPRTLAATQHRPIYTTGWRARPQMALATAALRAARCCHLVFHPHDQR